MTPEDRPTVGAARAGRLSLSNALLLTLLAVWVVWWVVSVRDDVLRFGKRTWVGPLPFLAGDFRSHVDHFVRIKAAGVDPYGLKKDYFASRFPYPPMVPRLFAWTPAFEPRVAAAVWLAGQAGILTLGAWSAWRSRRELRLGPFSWAAIAVALFYSTPAVFSMERGQVDPLSIAALLGVAWLARRNETSSQLAAGGLLGLTAWLKYYPGFAVVGLLALRRWKAAAAFVVVASAVGLYDRTDLLRSFENARSFAAESRKEPIVHGVSHSLVSNWRVIPVVRQVRVLRQIPANLAAAAIHLPLAAVVSLKVRGSRDPGRLLAPWLLWLSAVATFGMPYALDYNLLTLLIAALSVWDRRDSVWVHMAMGLLCLWWQPFSLNVGGEVLLAAKLAGLFAVGAMLVNRSREADALPIPSDLRFDPAEAVARSRPSRHAPTNEPA
ncbi:MAG: glycosyltransferase family 87 protein [Isosphaeraceae bacterium]